MNLNINLTQQQISTMAKNLNISEEELKKQAQAKENSDGELSITQDLGLEDNQEASLQALDSMALMNTILVNNKAKENSKSKTYTFKANNSSQQITVNGEKIRVSADLYGDANLKLVVAEDGKINVYSNGATEIDFSRAKQDLNINIVSSTESMFNVIGGKGNDVITVQEGANIFKVDGGDGNDIIVNNGAESKAGTISGGKGNDMIFNNSRISMIEGNAGDDKFFNFDQVSFLRGHSGNDTINNYGNVSFLNGNSGDDIINDQNRSTYTNGDEGNDVIAHIGSIAHVSNVENISKEFKGMWNGIYYDKGTPASGLYNKLMYQDGVLLTGQSSIDGETYKLGKLQPKPKVNEPDENGAITYTFTSKSKSQKITVNGETFSVSTNISKSNGSIKVVVDKDGKINVYSENASSISFANAKQDLNINIAKSNDKLNVTGGSGSDTITVQKGAKVFRVNGGQGNDTINNYGTASYLDGSSGNDTINNYGTTTYINGGDGDDTINNQGSASSIDGGKGTDTIAKRGTVRSMSKIENAGSGYTGKLNNIYYDNGKLANGLFNNIMYKDGLPFTGQSSIDGKYYKSGKPLNTSTTVRNSGTTATYTYKSGALTKIKIGTTTIPCPEGGKLEEIKDSNGKVTGYRTTSKEGTVLKYNLNGKPVTA